MSGDLAINRIGIKAIGKDVIIPEDDIAKLMYYLSCVCTVVNENTDSKLTDFQNYHLLTSEEEELLINLCSLFNPLIFIDAKIFILDPRLLAPGDDNEFFEITDHKIGLLVNE